MSFAARVGTRGMYHQSNKFPWKLMELLEMVDNVREIRTEKRKRLVKKLEGSIRERKY